MKLNEIMVRELREEHRDREWVAADGHHWAWVEDAWMWNLPFSSQPREWKEGTPCGAPFMEALHYVATRGQR